MKRSTWRLSLLPLLTLAFLTVALPANAQTPATTSSHAHFLGIRLPVSIRLTNNSNVTYHGGPIMPNTSTDYLIFWQPPGSKISKTFNSLVTRYFNDVGNTGLYANNSQYTDKQGEKPLASTLGATWVDTTPYPSNYISDKQLQQEVAHAMQVNNWTASLQHVFFVYTSRNVHICFDSHRQQCSPSSFCAYHNNFGNVLYAAMPDVLCGTPDSPNHNPEADNVIDSSSHEQMEAATDPLGNAWYDRSGNEIGDLCSTSYGPLKYHGGDVYWNNHPYTVQEEWDNAKSGCRLQGP